MTRVLINRNFAFLLGGRFISLFGDVLFDTTLGLWIVTQLARGQTWAPTALGGVLLAALIPVLLFGSIAGVFVDRWNKRKLMLRMDALRVLLICLLFPFTEGIPLPFTLPVLAKLLLIYLIVFLSSLCSQLFNPASFSLLGAIVDAEHQAQANGLLQMSSGGVAVLAPPVATAIFFATGAQVAIAFNAFSFLVSFLAVWAICPVPSPGQASSGRRHALLAEYVEGLRFLASNPILRAVLVGGFLAVISTGAQQALGIFFLQQNLHAPLIFYGVLLGTGGAGFIVGSLLAALFAQSLGVGRVFGAALFLEGVCFILYARSTGFLLACLLLFTVNLLVAVVNVAVNPLALYTTPGELIGRVAATAGSLVSLARTASISVAAVLASTVLRTFYATWLGISFGPFDTIFAVTGVLAIAGALYAIRHLWQVSIANREKEA